MTVWPPPMLATSTRSSGLRSGRRREWRLAACWITLGVIWAQTAAIAAPSFVGITSGARVNTAALSADGRTVVGETLRLAGSPPTLIDTTFLWTREEGPRSFDDLGPDAPSAERFTPHGLSGDGARVVGSLDGAPALWERGVGMVALPTVPGGTTLGTAYAISDDGTRVVGAVHDGGVALRQRDSAGGGVIVYEVPKLVPVLWGAEGASVVALTDIEGRALDVSNNGVVVGEWETNIYLQDPTQAFRWDEAGGPKFIPGVPGRFGATRSWNVAAVSADGTTVVGSTLVNTSEEFGWLPYAWQGAPQEDPTLPFDGLTLIRSPRTDATFRNQHDTYDVSADGSTIVGGYEVFIGFNIEEKPFFWTRDSGFQDLEVVLNALGVDTGEWELNEILDVSADGKTFLGRGRIRERGRPVEGLWIAVIPEPSTALLVGAGLVGLGARRRRR